MNNATLLSIIAIGISSLTLVWNILWSLHREFATPRLKVIFHVGAIYNVGGQYFFAAEGAITDAVSRMSDWEIQIKITNYGRDTLKVRDLFARRGIYKFFWSDDLRIQANIDLPIKIEYGEDTEIKLPFDEDCFLKFKFLKLGVIDNFGKSHWASRKDMKKARKLWKKEFGT